MKKIIIPIVTALTAAAGILGAVCWKKSRELDVKIY